MIACNVITTVMGIAFGVANVMLFKDIISLAKMVGVAVLELGVMKVYMMPPMATGIKGN